MVLSSNLELSTLDEAPMLIVSNHTLKILAALVWYAGGIVLLLKGGSLLVEAKTLRPEQDWIQLAPLAGLCVGGLKAKFLFYKSCRKNLASYKIPKLVEFVDQLPKTSSGKIMRYKLQEQLLKQ